MKTIKVYQATGLLFVMAAFIVFVVIGCSKDEKDEKPPGTENVNNYLKTLPAWNVFSPSQGNSVIESTPITNFNCVDKLVQTTTPCSITSTPEKVVTHAPGSEILYVGSLIQGKSYIGGMGSFESLPINQRGPVTVQISFLTPFMSKVIENPSYASVNGAIGEMVQAAHNAGHVSGSSIYFDQKISYSLKQTILALGLSVKYMVGQAQLTLGYQSTNETKTVSAYFVQNMFTVSMATPQRPGDFFSADFTQALLDEQVNLGRIGPDNLPVYVSNIVYGRMMTLTMTSDYSETEMMAALDASYKGIGGNISAEHLAILQNSTIKLVTIGGDAQAALDYLSSGNLGEFFKTNAPLTTAVPISYTLRNVGDNAIAAVSETTAYEMKQNEVVSVAHYKNHEQWKFALSGANMTYAHWQTTRPNMWLADESAGFSQHPTNYQIWMGRKITFSSSTTTYPFNFYLENKDPNLWPGHPNEHWGLVFEDKEGNQYGWPNSISIGDIDDFEDDDFEIAVTGNQVYAIGFEMVDNSTHATEYLEVWAVDGSGECQIALITNSNIGGFTNGFIGIISPTPIRRIFFNEDAGGDDIAIRHFYFGYRPQ